MKKTSNTAVSAATRSQTFASVGRAAKVCKVDSKELLSVFGKKIEDVPANLKRAWILAHDILRNYKKSNAKKAEAAEAAALQA